MTKEEYHECKQRFVTLLKSTGLEDIDIIIKELEDIGFFSAPASMKGHLCFEGGLMCHSLNVCDAAFKLKQTFMSDRSDIFDNIDDASIIIASLLHDVCKADLYFKKKLARVASGEAEFGTQSGDLPIGHGEKSVVQLALMGLSMTNEEICAIRWHMGPWCVNDSDSESRQMFRDAEKKYPLVSLIQMADTIATHFIERPPKTIN